VEGNSRHKRRTLDRIKKNKIQIKQNYIKMKRTIVIISSLLLVVFVCNAQIDSTKIQTNSLTTTVSKIATVDTMVTKAPADSMKYALLYVYRPKNFVGFAISYELKVSNNGSAEMAVGRVKNNAKFVVKLYQEGPTEITARTESKRVVKLNVKFGAKYYLKCGITMGVMVGRPELNLVYPEQGELDYSNM